MPGFISFKATVYKLCSFFSFFFCFKNKKKEVFCVCLNKMSGSGCCSHCFSLGDAYERTPRRFCLTRKALEQKEKWVAGKELESVSIFQCSRAQVGDEELAFLGQLRNCDADKIKYLSIWSNFTDRTAEQVAEIVKKSTCIEELYLLSDEITARSYVAIAKALETNTSLKKLVIFNPKTPVELIDVDPLFVYALAVNSGRPLDSVWSFSNRKLYLGFDFERIRDVAAGFTFILDCREHVKKRGVRSARIMAKVPPTCYKRQMKKLRKHRQHVIALDSYLAETRQ